MSLDLDRALATDIESHGPDGLARDWADTDGGPTVAADPRAAAATPDYPWHLVERLWLLDGTAVTIRPIRASDLALEAAFVAGLSKESRYQRLLSGRDLFPGELRKLTDIDYRREMALIATVWPDGVERQIGVARYVMDAADGNADVAIVVADAWQRRGLGERLLHSLVQAARNAGLRTLTGITLATNERMQALATRVGFRLRREPGDATVLRLLCNL